MAGMFWCDFMAGWVGGCAGLLVGHPFDTLKVRQQAFTDSSLAKVTLDCMKNEGVRGLFKGMYYPILSAGALNSLFFGVYGVSLRFMTSLRADANAGTTSASSTSIKPTNWEIFWAGCAGGAAQLVVACPVDVAKIKLQTQTGTAGDRTHYKGPYDCLKSIYRTQGIKGWYKGLVPMAWRDLPSFGLYMVLYDNILNNHNVSCQIQSETWLGIRLSTINIFLGVISWIVIIYLDVVKSRIQADDPLNPKYKGMMDCFKQCYKEGGFRIFGRGMFVMSLRAFPLNGATFLG
eukprot:14145.XXX_304979_300326_1 [CDS] Oithona nana genome sequencing.